MIINFILNGSFKLMINKKIKIHDYKKQIPNNKILNYESNITQIQLISCTLLPLFLDNALSLLQKE